MHLDEALSRASLQEKDHGTSELKQRLIVTILFSSAISADTCCAFGGLVYPAQRGTDGTSDGSGGLLVMTGISVVFALPFAISGTTKGPSK